MVQEAGREAVIKKRCPLGEACDLTIAWMAGRKYTIDRYREESNPIIEAQAAEIERLRDALARAMDGLKECEAEIDAYIQIQYPHDHPVQERCRQRDYAANPARVTLAELTGAKP